MANIFVVDDSVSVRKALEIALKPHSTRNAISGEDALGKIDDEPFDLMITDIIMPGINGFELCQQVKNDPRYAHIPILIISGNVDDETRREAQQAGAEDILRKPFRPDELRPVVQRFLELSEQRKANLGHEVNSSSNTQTSAQTTTQTAQVNWPIASALYNQNGQLLEHTGQVLPESIGQYARFYLSTAQVLGQQLDQSLSGVQLQFSTFVAHFQLVDDKLKVELLLK